MAFGNNVGLPLRSGQHQIEVAADLRRHTQGRCINRIINDDAFGTGFKDIFGHAQTPDAQNARGAVTLDEVQHGVGVKWRLRMAEGEDAPGKMSAVLPIEANLFCRMVPNFGKIHQATVYRGKRQPLKITTNDKRFPSLLNVRDSIVFF